MAYAHKILTGRRSKMHTIRKTSGLAGFPKLDESVFDAFGTGHSSTSISAALGMGVARDLLGKNNKVIAVIGDGGMMAGQAYEAINNARHLRTNLIVILNDNGQVPLPTATLDAPTRPVDALSVALSKLRSFKPTGGQKHGEAMEDDEHSSGTTRSTKESLFRDLGMNYIGPIDGHNMEELIVILTQLKETPVIGPILIHVVTEKGKGYPPAETALDKMQGKIDRSIDSTQN